MKTMTCRQLGGACDLAFHAETFEDMEAQSKQHGMEMFQQSDAAHLAAMQKIRDMMQDPQAIEEWMQQRRLEFEALPED